MKNRLDSIQRIRLYGFMEHLNYLECDGEIYKSRYHKYDLNKFTIEEINFEDFKKLCDDWYENLPESTHLPENRRLIKVV